MNQLTIDELEVLTPDQLRVLLWNVINDSMDIQYIQNLLDVGCPIDARNNDGITALHIAAVNGNHEAIEVLVSNGADVNIAIDGTEEAPLHWAAAMGKLKAVRSLLQRGADIQAKNIGGYTALHLATMNKCFEIVELLLSLGAEVNAVDNHGHTAWDSASGIIRISFPELKP